MKCIFCNFEETQVIDTRVGDDKLIIKRRRKCTNCDKRFNTLEKIDLQMPAVVKQNGTRQEYDESKIYNSMVKALHKRPVSLILVDNATDIIRQKILNLGEREVASRVICEMIITELSKLDKIGYIRYASIYLSFQDLKDFSKIIETQTENPQGEQIENN